MRLAFALCLSLVVAAPAASQGSDRETIPGSRISEKIRRDWENAEVRLVQQRFADCVVKNHYADAATFLVDHPTADNDDGKVQSLINKITDGSCLIKATDSRNTVVMRFPADTLRYALADTLVRREFVMFTLNDLDRVAGLSHPSFDPAEFLPKPGKKPNAKLVAKLEANRDKELSRIYLSQLGECVVRLDPNKSHALLMTDVTTTAENSAFNAIAPRLGECITQGQTVKLNKGIVRGAVAYVYYRLAKAPRGPAQVAGAPK